MKFYDLNLHLSKAADGLVIFGAQAWNGEEEIVVGSSRSDSVSILDSRIAGGRHRLQVTITRQQQTIDSVN